MSANNFNNIQLAKLDQFRKKLANLDEKMIRILDDRMKISYEIGKLKLKNQLDIEQADFWEISSEYRRQMLSETNINESFIEKIFDVIHQESIDIQKQVFKEQKNGKK